MEKIDLVELLKDCPKGMELDCINCNGIVSFEEILDNDAYPIKIKVIYNNECNIHTLTKYGQTLKNSYNKCVIFPKGKTTWEGFVPPCKFKDGDIVYIKTNVFEHIFIFKVSKDDKFIEGYASLSGTGLYLDGYPVCETNDVKEIRLATQQEKEKLFDILKPTGYHWNNETKTLEYMIKPKFKVGDKIRSKNKKDECFYILNVDEDNYKYVLNIKGYYLEFKDQDNYELVSDISIEPKFKIGDKVRYKNNHNIAFTITNIEEDTYVCGTKIAFWFEDQDKFELVPNKFDISTLKPFDKVLVRDANTSRWDITFYELYDNTNISYPYRTLGGMIYKYCIPYEGNEHLVGLVKECDDYYKSWINEED